MEWMNIIKNVSSFEQKIRSQAIPIEELDDNRVRCTICKGPPDYKTPVTTGGKEVYVCEKCLKKAIARHMKEKEQKEREADGK